MAYLFDDKTTKLKAPAGTGFRFPSLYEAYYAYGALPESRRTLKAETSKGFDLGLEKSFTDLERRDCLVLGGSFQDKVFVSTISLLTGTYKNSWLGIRNVVNIFLKRLWL